MITVTVNNRKAVAVPLTDVTTGATGIPVSFHFSEDWDGLSKVAVFRTDNGGSAEMAILMNQTTVPHEVLTNAYDILWIGVYGENAGGTIIIPTIWANAGAIQPGTESEAYDPAEPTPSWAAQVQAAAEEALEIAAEIQTAAARGDFDGEDGQDGADGVSPAVTLTSITGGTQVTITDADHPSGQSFNVMNGKDGKDGKDGRNGADGAQGPEGPKGQKGDKGDQGVKGDKGDTGAQGETGPQGEQGETGPQGNGIASFHEYGSGTDSEGRHYIDYVIEFDDGSEETIRVHDGLDGTTVQSDWNQTDTSAGDYIKNKPAIPAAQVQSDWGQSDNEQVDFIKNKPSIPEIDDTLTQQGEAADAKATGDALADLDEAKADIIISSASGEVASFEDGAPYPVKDLTVSIDPVQDLHGYDSPWPAGGGKNLFPYPYPNFTEESKLFNDVTITNLGDGRIKLNGTASNAGAFILMGKTQWDQKYEQPAGEYIFSAEFQNTPSTGFSVSFQMTDGSANIEAPVTPGNNNIHRTFTTGLSMTGNSAARNMYIAIEIGTAFNNAIIGPMIRKAADADSSFAPYSNICPIYGWTGCNLWREAEYDPTANPTLQISWQSSAGTVYGGTLDVTTGVLTVTHGYIASYDGETINEPWISSIDAYESGTTPSTGAQVVYPLTTALTYQLDPVTLSTLLGENNIWADCGPIENVEYRADTKLYIEKLTQPTEDDMIANQNISSGVFFMIGNSLFFSTSSIAAGEQIVPGTGGNCTALSLADALNNLNS